MSIYCSKMNIFWDKLSRVVVFLLFVAGCWASFSGIFHSFSKTSAIVKKFMRWTRKITEEERLARQYKSAIESLQNDPRTLERVAREKLGLARSNETVIRFETPLRK